MFYSYEYYVTKKSSLYIILYVLSQIQSIFNTYMIAFLFLFIVFVSHLLSAVPFLFYRLSMYHLFIKYFVWVGLGRGAADRRHRGLMAARADRAPVDRLSARQRDLDVQLSDVFAAAIPQEMHRA